MNFIPNVGQTDPAVRFYVKDMGHTLFFTSDEVVFSLVERTQPSSPGGPIRLSETEVGLWAGRPERLLSADSALTDKESRRTAVVRLRFAGANPAPKIEGVDPLPGIANFFLGNDPSKWYTEVPTYGGVAYRELYPGVDLIYRGTDGTLKSEFRVSPGADPGVIRMVYSGEGAVTLSTDGTLALQTALGELVEGKSLIYQEIDGIRQEIPGRYVVYGEEQVGFEVGAYDASRPLVIDPVLSYYRRFGGSAFDASGDIAVDSSGNAYVTGDTISADFPLAPGDTGTSSYRATVDAFVTKFDSNGLLVYATYLGGRHDTVPCATDESGNPIHCAQDYGYGVAVDDRGNAYITGQTYSADFPVVAPIPGGGTPRHAGTWTSEAFVARLDANGSSLLFSTYIGGSDNDAGQDIAVDSQGYASIVGNTQSGDFPVTTGGYHGSGDAFVARLSPGVMHYATYVGGSFSEYGYGIGVDKAGNAYVTGVTYSSDLTTTPHALQGTLHGRQDAFLVKINTTGTIAYATYLGGTGSEVGSGVTVDGKSSIFLTGITNSPDFSTTSGALDRTCGTDGQCNFANQFYYTDVFIVKLSPAATNYALDYATYLGGSADELGTAIAVDVTGNAYVTGWTGSYDFPKKHPLPHGDALYAHGGAFVSALDSTGAALLYSTHLGRDHFQGAGIDASADGSVYVTGEIWGHDIFIANIQGNTFIVNETADSPDADPGDGRCDRDLNTPGAQCTLRAAIQQVNALSGGGYRIIFNLPRGTTINTNSTLEMTAGKTTIDGDMDGDGTPDVAVVARWGQPALTIRSASNIIQNLAAAGISIEGTDAHDNVIRGSYLGTDVTGKGAAAQVSVDSVRITNSAHDNTIQGSVIAGAVMASGVLIDGGAHDNQILGNRIGVNVDDKALPNDVGVRIKGGAHDNHVGRELRTATDCTDPCNTIAGNKKAGVLIEGIGTYTNTVQGNYIGVKPGGATIPNNIGVHIKEQAAHNIIGGDSRTDSTCTGPCNVISGNKGHGILLEQAHINKVQGNYIGPGPDGMAALPNGGSGIEVSQGSVANLIGGPRAATACAGPCNVISGNNEYGVQIEDSGTWGNKVQGNYVGVRPDGRGALPNSQSGIKIKDGASQNEIGGEHATTACTGPCNVLSGNRKGGVVIGDAGSDNNVVRGNYIGVNPQGTAALPNDIHGVFIARSASHNIIGGRRPGSQCTGPCNAISGNKQLGLVIVTASHNQVQGNYIGLGPDGNLAMPNKLGGVYLTLNAQHNLIGSTTTPLEGNVIAHNGSHGVYLSGDQTRFNTIRYNSIYGNTKMGIAIESGTQNNVRPPEVLAAFNPQATKAFAIVVASPGATVDIYIADGNRYGNTNGNSEGKTFLASGTIGANRIATIDLPFSKVSQNTLVTATATDAQGNTSQFSFSPALKEWEVTQAIQNLKNSVVLIKDRPTFVRAHVGELPVDAGLTQQRTRSRLIGRRDGSELHTLLMAPAQLRDTPHRIASTDSLLFALPRSWRNGTVELELGNLAFRCLDPPSQGEATTAKNDCKIRAQFQASPQADLRLFPITWAQGGNTHQPTRQHLRAAVRQIQAIFPVPSLSWTSAPRLSPRSFRTRPPTTTRDFTLLNRMLARQRTLDCRTNSRCSKRYYLGVLIDEPASRKSIDVGQAESSPGNVASGYLDNDNTVAHELGHLVGLEHVRCDGSEPDPDTTYPYPKGKISRATSGRDAFYGFDIRNRRVYGPTTGEFMSYCSPNWISDWNYNRIRTRLIARYGTPRQAPARLLAVAAGQPAVMVSGLVTETQGTASLDPLYTLTVTDSIPAPDPGPYTIRFEDGAGQQLAAYPFAPSSGADHGAAAAERPGMFVLMLPWPAGTERIVLLHNGQVLDARTASANAPIVTVTSPNGGEVLSGTVMFTWTANDLDGDPLTYAVQYSSDGGTSWETLVTDWSTPTLEVDLDFLPGSTQALIRVQASDGVHTAEDQSDAAFTVSGHAPLPYIDSPQNDALYRGDETILLEGGALDLEDGSLDDTALSWRSDLDGDLGLGASLVITASDLTEGIHSITLTAQDSEGQIGTQGVTITVYSLSTVLSPTVALAPGALLFTATAGDTETEPQLLTIRNIGDGTLAWSASAGQSWLQMSAISGTAPADLTITAEPSGLAAGEYSGTITITASSAVHAPQSVPVTLLILPKPGPDLALAKTDARDPVAPGSPLTYTLTVVNHGPLDSTGVALTDTLPTSVTFAAVASSQGSCSQAGGAVICNLGALAAGDTVTVTLVVTPSVRGILTNTAYVDVAAVPADPNPENNTATAQTLVTRGLAVNSTGDAGDTNPGDGVCDDGSGKCTLRAAIQEANALAGTDTIVFYIPGAGPHTIRPNSPLPEITDPLIIDGSSEPDFAGAPVVELDGSNAGDYADGLAITAGNSTVRGLLINRFSRYGVRLFTASGSVLEGNYIGTDVSGTAAALNGQYSVFIAQSANNRIGGPTAPSRNLIAGNILIGGVSAGLTTGNLVEGNYVGTNAAGTAGLGYVPASVIIEDADNNTVASNVIVEGVYIHRNLYEPAAGNIVRDNKIGTDVTGTQALGNFVSGVLIENGVGNSVENNLISGNGQDGVWILGSSSRQNQIRGNRIGTNADGTAPLGNGGYGIRIGVDDGFNWEAGGREHVIAQNLIAANGQGGILLACYACQVVSNTIGTNAAGTAALGNMGTGIYVSSVSSNTIRSNLISGNTGKGIEIDNSFGSATANSVQGNRIGTNAAGTAALGNGQDGVTIRAHGNLIGGTDPGEGNLISGNSGHGVNIGDAIGNQVLGNLIGTDATGAVALGNAFGGIYVFGDSNTIGGTEAGAGNLISGNGGNGIELLGSRNVVQGNRIGTDSNGTADLGNGGHGVWVQGNTGSDNEIGGSLDGAGNTIAYNGGAGVRVSDSGDAGNTILGNAIYANDGLGIDLEVSGMTANDPDERDTVQNFPLLAVAAPGSTIVQGALQSTAYTTFTLQFFANNSCDPSGYGEGEVFLGAIEVTSDGSGNAAFEATFPAATPLGNFVTATATDPLGNTSEFSPCTVVAQWADLALTKTLGLTPAESGNPLTYTVTVANNGPVTATQVILTDTLPASMAFSSATASQGSCSPPPGGPEGAVTCDLGTLADNASATVTLVVTPTTTGIFTNTASVAAAGPDPDLANNTATASTPVNPADLAVAKSAWPQPALAGQPLTYTISVVNRGPLTATGVRLTDTLPAGMIFGSVTPGQGSCSPPNSGGPGGAAVTCNLGTLADGSGAMVTLVVTPTAAGLFTNTVTVSAAESDADPANNTATASTLVSPTDLSLTTVTAPVLGWVGYPLTYTLVVSNSGPAAASGIALTDTLPATAHFVSATPAGACSETWGTVTCGLGTLSSGAQITVTLVISSDAIPDPFGIFGHTVVVGGHEPDTDRSNNQAVLISEIRRREDENWDDRFASPGVPGTVFAIAFGSDDTVYVGGIFDQAGKAKAFNVARWDGQRWHPLGLGVNEVVNAIAVDGNQVYVAGEFTTAYQASGEAVNASYIARWDGSHWSALGDGVDGTVHALAIDSNGQLYVGGEFTTAGGAEALHLARWDGTHWSAVGGGVNNDVFALARSASGALYVGGAFTQAGGIPANGIARWDGDRWSVLGEGVSGGNYGYGIVSDIALSGDDVYVIGNFTSAGAGGAPGIARWDGSAWHSPASAVPDGAFTGITALGSDIYVVGSFTEIIEPDGITSVPTRRFARWDGSHWSEVGNGVGAAPEVIVAHGSDLYLGGARTVDDLGAGGIARWDGTQWSLLAESDGGQGIVAGEIHALAVGQQDEVFAGGCFEAAGRLKSTAIARWDGVQWTALGGDVQPGLCGQGQVEAIAHHGSDLYIGGSFLEVGGVSANDIARWDRATGSWSALGNGLSGEVLALAVNRTSGALYAGGLFADLGYVARWDGNNWSALGGGLDHWAVALAVNEATGDLYAGGWFNTAGGVSTNHIARWDGSQWHALGSGVDGWLVSAIAIDKTSGDVYVGGDFTTAGGVSANYIARWDSTTSSWHALGSGTNGPVSAIVLDESTGDVYVGGQFTTAGGTPANFVARWDDTTLTWHALGSGVAGGVLYSNVTDQVHALALGTSDLLVGGSFAIAGRKPSVVFARWSPTPDLSISQIDRPDPVVVDTPMTYTIAITNAGLLTATQVILTDTLSATALFGAVTAGQGNCSSPNAGGPGGAITCNLGALASGANTTVAVMVTPTVAGLITNTVVVAAREPDRNPLDNSASANTLVTSVDLRLAQTSAPQPAWVNQVLTYTLVVTNSGPATATGVTLVDIMPASALVRGTTATQGTGCNAAAGVLTCNLGDLASGAEATVTLAVIPTRAGTATNMAVATANEPDHNMGDNNTLRSTEVMPAERCAYDFDGDSLVSVADIMMVAGRWNLRATDQDYEARFDLDSSGTIDLLDIAAIAGRWHETCP